MWPGHRALHYYVTSASTGNEDLGEMCFHRADQWHCAKCAEAHF